MNIVRALGKYVDQPLVVAKCSKAVPAVLCSGAAIYGFKDIKNSKEDKKKVSIKTLCALTGTVASALIATRGFKPIQKIFKNFEGLSPKYDIKELTEENTKAVVEFLQKNKVGKEIQELLEKAKSKILNPKEVKALFSELEQEKNGVDLLKKLIPDPESATSEKIKSEIGRLSILGLVPIIGGISGGIIGDRLTEKDWKQRIPNKIKEGSYQYLANIFLCNVGAGAALGIMEKMNIKSKAARAAGMVGGILAFGVIGGSAIANIIGKKFIDPLLGIKHKNNDKIYDERKPEAIDIGLHVDDIATVSVMSGLRWIEPALPILYSISGYRAGIGYRNGDNHTHGQNHHHGKCKEKNCKHNHNEINYKEMFFNPNFKSEKQFSENTFKAFS